MQNEAQYNLDRKAAKISALSSNNLDKYEYLTGEDLGLKPGAIAQAKFEYSPLDEIFTKGLKKEEDKKEGLLKRLKNIEDKNKEQLKEIKNKTAIKSQIDLFDEDISSEAAAQFKEIKDIGDNVDYNKLFFTDDNKKVYGFKKF